MSSRQQEKEKRKQERLERERAEAARTTRMRRLQLLVGGVLAAAAIAAVALAVGSGDGDGGAGPKASSVPGVKIPATRITDLDKAVAAAKCAVRTFPVQGSTHVDGPVDYKTNPPTSGDHNATPAADGIYDAGNEPAKENYVHTLEHGRIELQYKPGTPRNQIRQLEAVFNEELNGIPGYHMLLFQNNTSMPYAVAATAWTHLLGCRTFNDRIFDAIRAFRARYTDKGPEKIP